MVFLPSGQLCWMSSSAMMGILIQSFAVHFLLGHLSVADTALGPKAAYGRKRFISSFRLQSVIESGQDVEEHCMMAPSQIHA